MGPPFVYTHTGYSAKTARSNRVPHVFARCSILLILKSFRINYLPTTIPSFVLLLSPSYPFPSRSRWIEITSLINDEAEILILPAVSTGIFHSGAESTHQYYNPEMRFHYRCSSSVLFHFTFHFLCPRYQFRLKKKLDSSINGSGDKDSLKRYEETGSKSFSPSFRCENR